MGSTPVARRIGAMSPSSVASASAAAALLNAHGSRGPIS
jgi:hypothetical protein